MHINTYMSSVLKLLIVYICFQGAANCSTSRGLVVRGLSSELEVSERVEKQSRCCY
jgi:hypothetical protein